jgi:hypothetical protein
MLSGKIPLNEKSLSNCLKKIDSNLSFELVVEESHPKNDKLNEVIYKIRISNTQAKISTLMMGVESLGYTVSLLHTTRKLCGS